jgi:hypothetical protein
VVEHVIPSSFLIRRSLQRAEDCRVIGHRMLAVRIRPRIGMRVAQWDRSAMQNNPNRSLPACIFDGPKTSGYLSLVRLQSEAPNASVAKWYSNSRVVPCPSAISSRHVQRCSTATLNHGGRMANHILDSKDSNFEITRKRRKGFPSETRVKRGERIVHGTKQLFEKLGRKDLCPCGSGRSFQEVLSPLGTIRRF